MVSISWDLPSGRRVVASGSLDEVLGSLSHIANLETRLLTIEQKVERVEEMAASVLQLEKIGRRLLPKEKTG